MFRVAVFLIATMFVNAGMAEVPMYLHVRKSDSAIVSWAYGSSIAPPPPGHEVVSVARPVLPKLIPEAKQLVGETGYRFVNGRIVSAPTNYIRQKAGERGRQAMIRRLATLLASLNALEKEFARNPSDSDFAAVRDELQSRVTAVRRELAVPKTLSASHPSTGVSSGP